MTKLSLTILTSLIAALLVSSPALGAKAKYERTKPHVNVSPDPNYPGNQRPNDHGQGNSHGVLTPRTGAADSSTPLHPSMRMEIRGPIVERGMKRTPIFRGPANARKQLPSSVDDLGGDVTLTPNSSLPPYDRPGRDSPQFIERGHDKGVRGGRDDGWANALQISCSTDASTCD